MNELLNNPWVINATFLLLGTIATSLYHTIRNRRTPIYYTTSLERIAESKINGLVGNIEIKWNGYPVSNLYRCTIDIINVSSRDFSDVKFKILSEPETILFEEDSQILNTTEYLRLTNDYINQIRNIQYPEQSNYLRLFREYLIPIYNRKSVVRTISIFTSTHKDPMIFVEMLHEGLILKYRHKVDEIIGIPITDTLPVSIIIAVLVLINFSIFTSASPLTVLIILIIGLFATPISALIIMMWRKIKNLYTG
jgi:hypothetical protein